MGKKVFTFILSLSFFLISTRLSFAISQPSFPVCSFPTGTLKVSYDEGSHGIPGDMAEYQGRDDVYEVNDTISYQCFCADNGEGIQTNWWKISGLAQSDIDYLKRLGWIYVPDGNLWGLTGDPYLALSTTYTCGAGGVGGGEVLGVNTWNLAATGNKPLIFLLIGLGMAFFLLGWLVQKKSQQS